MQKWIILVVVLIIIILGGFLVFNSSIETDYTPQAEIGDIDLRKTIVSLYFQNKETKEIQKESRLIDSKKLLQNPYKELIDMLIKGPQSDSLESVIPEGTTVLSVVMESNCAVVNFSKGFIEGSITDETKMYNSVYSIVNTLTELTEVSSIRILIEGEETEGFANIGLDFRNEFSKASIRQENLNKAD